ncbi:S-protein homolog 5-like [Argentina anserina]|uniref:S-protein homolog 5-like n=1 Tax=Argentina anserina TaxID=57926 RepID=UPI0021766B3F|nr:S-protein homolog 5-like [Potentilla anserina]
MKIINSILLLCGLAFFVIFMSLLEPQNLLATEFDVRVINGFTNNSSLPLVIWCSSKENDLGGRALQEKDDFSWRLRTNIWGSTNHFVCTMKWDARRRRFDAFKIPRDVQRCGPFRKCSWLVREDGFYFSSDEVNWKKDFSW